MHALARPATRLALCGLLGCALPAWLPGQQPALPPPSADLVEIVADSQQKSGEVYLFRGQVRIRTRGMRLEADEVVYDEANRTAHATGHVVFERETDRLEADRARTHLPSGAGVFWEVRGTTSQPARPSRDFLVSSRALYFEGKQVERFSDGTYVVHQGWVTNCDPGAPKWRLRTARARIRPNQDAVLHRATFSLRGVTLLYAPLWWMSLAERPRQSGFLMPTFGNDSRRGTNFSSAFFWALNPHADVTLGAHFFNQGGWTQNVQLRARPTPQSQLEVTYFGAIARSFSQVEQGNQKVGVDQTGQYATVLFLSPLPHGFRTVVDVAYLSSFSFRQGFAETYDEAITSEVHSTAYLTNQHRSLYFNGFFERYQSFLQAEPESSVTLLAAPGVEFGAGPLALDRGAGPPLYFSFDSSLTGLRRDEPRYQTPELVQRFSLYPRVTVPLWLGRYFHLTPTFGLRATRYSARLVDDPAEPTGKRVENQALRRLTQEVSLEVGLPSLARIFEARGHRYKHVLEPAVTYRYRNGVRRFGEILRFDETDILTDTHEVEYSLRNRLFRKEGKDGPVQEIFSWQLSQKYYFDPTFRDSLRPGARNVTAALLSLTPFAFADQPRRFSPLVSVLKLTPRGRWDTEFRTDYDPTKNLLANTRLLARFRASSLLRFSLQHITTRNNPILQARSNQVGFTTAYGNLFRRGLNAAFSLNWNLREHFNQHSIVQLSYNWDCCGFAFEYRRLGIGPLRSQNEFRFAFTIANIGTFGTIRERERLF